MPFGRTFAIITISFLMVVIHNSLVINFILQQRKSPPEITSVMTNTEDGHDQVDLPQQASSGGGGRGLKPPYSSWVVREFSLPSRS
jgi:hypothetical protein